MELTDKVINDIVKVQLEEVNQQIGGALNYNLLGKSLYQGIINYQKANIGNEPIDWKLVEKIEQEEKLAKGKGSTGGQKIRIRNAMSGFYNSKHYGSGEEFTNDEGLKFYRTEGVERMRNFGKYGLNILEKYLERVGMIE